MSLPLYMDEHVKSAVTTGRRQRGIDVITVQEDGYVERDDAEILARATDLKRVLFTQDDDFLVIAHSWQMSSREFYGVVYGHQLELTIGIAVNHLQVVCEAVTPAEIHNTIVFLPL